jgi:flavodoxin
VDIEVYYQSRGGNTKTIAETVAEVAGVKAHSVTEPFEGADLLFLGGAVYGFKLDDSLVEFINNLDSDKVGYVAVFGTSGLSRTPVKAITKALGLKGIKFFDDVYLAKMGLSHKSKPSAGQREDARSWAAGIIKEFES